MQASAAHAGSDTPSLAWRPRRPRSRKEAKLKADHLPTSDIVRHAGAGEQKEDTDTPTPAPTQQLPSCLVSWRATTQSGAPSSFTCVGAGLAPVVTSGLLDKEGREDIDQGEGEEEGESQEQPRIEEA